MMSDRSPLNTALQAEGAFASRSVELTCICCPMGCLLRATISGGVVTQLHGNGCPRGEKYARQECVAPKRVVTGTAPVSGGLLPRASLKTAEAVDRARIPEVMAAVHALHLRAPVCIGEILLKDVAGTGTDLIATRSVPAVPEGKQA